MIIIRITIRKFASCVIVLMSFQAMLWLRPVITIPEDTRTPPWAVSPSAMRCVLITFTIIPPPNWKFARVRSPSRVSTTTSNTCESECALLYFPRSFIPNPKHPHSRKEHQPNIQMGNGRSANYRAIEWTQPRVDELFTMYIQDPLSMQCNQSDGNRFPGYDWEDAPITPVKIQMPIDSYRFCKNVFPPAKWSDSIQNGLCDMFGDCIY